MATINEPTPPAYGPGTFTELATALDVLFNNDQSMNSEIGGGGGLSIVEGTITWDTTEYETITGGMNPRLFRVDPIGLVILTGGMRGRNVAASPATYYDVGTIPSGFRPSGPGSVFSSGTFAPTPATEHAVRTRVQTSGSLSFRTPEGGDNSIMQLSIPTMIWPVNE